MSTISISEEITDGKSDRHGRAGSMDQRVCLFPSHWMEVDTTEGGQRLRAAYADLRGLLDRKNWEATSMMAMKHLWLTDCESLSNFLNDPAPNGFDDKRLLIDLENQRQPLWEDVEGNPNDALEEN